MTANVLKHESIKQGLLHLIEKGDRQDAHGKGLVTGDRLPSLRDLARQHRASLTPVRRAIAELMEQGLLETMPGRQGVFVSSMGAKTSHQASQSENVAVAYEGSEFHQELGQTQLLVQLMIDSVAQQAAQVGLKLNIFPHKPINGDEQDMALLETLAKHKAVLLAYGGFRHWAGYLQSKGCHVVCLTTHPHRDLPATHAIRWDQFHGYCRIIAYLAELGHRQVGYMGLLEPSVSIKAEALIETALAKGLEFKSQWFQHCPGYTSLDGYLAAKQMIERLGAANLPTAIVADTDYRAIGVMTALKEAGLSVPKDISVVGFDNRPEAATAEPGLTTVGPDWLLMGQNIVEMLQAGLSQQAPAREMRVIPFSLQIRQSTAAPLIPSPISPPVSPTTFPKGTSRTSTTR